MNDGELIHGAGWMSTEPETVCARCRHYKRHILHHEVFDDCNADPIIAYSVLTGERRETPHSALAVNDGSCPYYEEAE
jgi:hypothetical protein